jgi:hypothetical protein
MRLEGLSQLKNPMNSSGFESATFRLVALCLNQLRCRVPPASSGMIFIPNFVQIRPRFRILLEDDKKHEQKSTQNLRHDETLTDLYLVLIPRCGFTETSVS